MLRQMDGGSHPLFDTSVLADLTQIYEGIYHPSVAAN